MWIRRAITVLAARKPREVQAVVMRCVEGYTFREVGEFWGVSGNRAMQITQKGIRLLVGALRRASPRHFVRVPSRRRRAARLPMVPWGCPACGRRDRPYSSEASACSCGASFGEIDSALSWSEGGTLVCFNPRAMAALALAGART